MAKPRYLKGTIYTRDGKTAKGVIVTADKSRDKYYSSFDGAYEIKAKTKSKWLRFRFPDGEKTMSIQNIERDVIDFRDGITKTISEQSIGDDNKTK
jgi:hypothetical protein